MEGSSTERIRGTFRPQFFYASRSETNQLHRVSLLTGEQYCHQIAGYQFKEACRLSELPGDSLLITGGCPAVREVVKIDTLREWTVSCAPPMHTARQGHAAVYHSHYLYVLGGYNDWYLSECERYVCEESRWEGLPALPVAGTDMSAVEMDNSLYALGGNAGGNFDTVQKLRLDSLTWELMQLKLPQAESFFPCFKSDTQVYLVINQTLYSFTPLQVKAVKTLTGGVFCYSSYYSTGTLYYEDGRGMMSLAVGELTSH
jgi:hypothetical protein